MKKLGRLSIIVGLAVLISLLFIPHTLAASYRLPTAWQIVYLNSDGSLDVYDYRHYKFDGGPPSDTLPYKLEIYYGLYDRTISYSNFEAYILESPLEDILKSPLDIKNGINKISKHKLTVNSIGDFEYHIHVPDKDTLLIVVHYKVSNDITVVGKDFARTYYALPTLGKSNVYVDNHTIAFVLPRKLSCGNSTPQYDPSDSKCPCFKVIRFLPEGGPTGRYYKSCQYIAFESSNFPVTTQEEIDAVYPKSLIVKNVWEKLQVSQSWKDVQKWQKMQAIDTGFLFMKFINYIVLTIISYIIYLFFANRKYKIKKKYYKKIAENVPATMEMPNERVLRSIFFTDDDLNYALSGKEPRDLPLDIDSSSTPTEVKLLIKKGGAVFRAAFFNLMKKGYIQPITDGDKILGFQLQESSASLEPIEKEVLQHVKEAAKINVEKKKGKGFLGLFKKKEENLADVMNERDPENILLPEEFEAYLKKHMKTITLKGGVEAKIPQIAQIGANLIKHVKETEDIPEALGPDVPEDIKGKVIRALRWERIVKYITLGLLFTALTYLLLSFTLSFFFKIIPIKAVYTSGPILILILLIFKGFIYSPVQIELDLLKVFWITPEWWHEFKGWKGVQRWIEEFTRIAKKEISAYETLNWDNYFVFAILRGIEKKLIDVLKIIGVFKEKGEEQYMRNYYTYMMATNYMYYHSWTEASTTFTHSFNSAYESAHKSGTTSGGGFSSGSSFGGGSGGGGGSTGW